MDEFAKELIKEVAGDVYKDIASPSIQPLGTIFSYLPRTIRLAFSR